MPIGYLLEILDRTRNGPLCTVKDWETRVIPTKVSQKLKEHRLLGTFNREDPINVDDALADEFFKAGFELAVDVGLLCQDTERVIKVTEDELWDALRNAPSELALGKGRDMVLDKARRPEDTHPPLARAPIGTPISEDLWVPLHQALAEVREIDVFCPGTLTTIFGRPALAGTPYETLAGRYEAQLVKEALWRAGRPGMCTDAVDSSPTEYGQLGGFGIKGGYDPDIDVALCLPPPELKTSYATLHKVAHTLNCGGMVKEAAISMIGGSSGPPEGSALVAVAYGLLSFTVHQAIRHVCLAEDTRYGGNCGREGQWATSVSLQAFSRNTHILLETTIDQVAGPCTEMLLYESAVGVMIASASGVSAGLFPRSAKSVLTDYLTPLECKFCAEVLKRSAGMTRKQVNEIAKVLIPKYEGMLMRPPIGKSFRECYDLETMQPTQEWLDIYTRVKAELIELGVPL